MGIWEVCTGSRDIWEGNRRETGDAIGIMARNRIVDTKTSRFGVRAPRNPHSELRTREPKTLYD